MIQEAGTQPLHKYIDQRHATVVEWVSLRPIFEVLSNETVYKGGEGSAQSFVGGIWKLIHS